MAFDSSVFDGDIPTAYDEGLGPVLFHPYGRMMAQKVAALAPARVLELAAGTGIVSRHLRDALAPDTHLTVTDFNDPMLEVARAKFGSGEAVDFQVADGMELPFADASYDTLACSFGIMFFPDKMRSLREAMRVLRPGGCYVCHVWDSLEHNPAPRIAIDIAAGFFPDGGPGFLHLPFHYFDDNVIEREFESAGFVDIDIERQPVAEPVEDLRGLARGFIHGNPMANEMRAMGNVDLGEVEETLYAAYTSEFGEGTPAVPFRAIMISAKKP